MSKRADETAGKIMVYTCDCGCHRFMIGPGMVCCDKCSKTYHFEQLEPGRDGRQMKIPSPYAFNMMRLNESKYATELTQEQAEALMSRCEKESQNVKEMILKETDTETPS